MPTNDKHDGATSIQQDSNMPRTSTPPPTGPLRWSPPGTEVSEPRGAVDPEGGAPRGGADSSLGPIGSPVPLGEAPSLSSGHPCRRYDPLAGMERVLYGDVQAGDLLVSDGRVFDAKDTVGFGCVALAVNGVRVWRAVRPGGRADFVQIGATAQLCTRAAAIPVPMGRPDPLE